MAEIIMKIKRSEYLGLKRIQTILTQENEALKKGKATRSEKEQVDYKFKKGAFMEAIISLVSVAGLPEVQENDND